MEHDIAEREAHSTHSRDFERLTRRFCIEAGTFGTPIIPSYDKFERFRSLDQVKQEDILRHFTSFYKLLMASTEEAGDVRDSRSTVWWAIKELGLRPPSDLFDLLDKNDVFEIYNAEGIQIFRSFNFFDLTSYSVEDIFTYSWTELYSRPGFITEAMLKSINTLMTGNVGNVMQTNFPLHGVTSIFAPGKECNIIKHKVFAILKSKSNQKFLFNAFKVTDQNRAEH